jgi:uncharacterized repeat protein (TIGR04138 family)
LAQNELFEKLDEILLSDSRYKMEAYVFVINALDYTMSRLMRQGHVTGPELLDGIRQLAKREFGPMARSVFENWGVTGTADFGEIVFTLVEAGLLGKTDEDSLSDFDDVYDFGDVFDDQYDWNVGKARW